MARIVIIILLVVGVFAIGRWTGGSKPAPVAPKQTSQTPAAAMPAPTPESVAQEVKVDVMKLDHRFGDALVKEDGQVVKKGVIINDGLVRDIKGDNVQVMSPDGKTKWEGTDREAVDRETVVVTGLVRDDSGHDEEVLCGDGRVFRVGRDCREGHVASIESGLIRIIREDGGLTLIAFYAAGEVRKDLASSLPTETQPSISVRPPLAGAAR